MTVRIANALNATTDQLLAHEFSHPEKIYLKEIAERIEKYPLSKRILACEGFNTYLDSLEKIEISESAYDEEQTLTEGRSITVLISVYI